MENVKILVIGCGSIGLRHIKNLLEIGAGEVLAFDPDPTRLLGVKGISNNVKIVSELREAWKQKPGAVVIATPTFTHIENALAAAEHGCHMFIEKPLGHSLEGVCELKSTVRKSNLISLVGYNFCYHDCIVKTKSLLSQGTIGNMISARTQSGSYLPERHPNEDYTKGYAASKEKGGGVILDSLSHHLSYWIHLMGMPSEVFCFSEKRGDLKTNVEDTVDVLLRFQEDGVASLHTNSWQRPPKHTLEIVGEKGTIFCDFVENAVKYFDVNTREWQCYHGTKDSNAMYYNLMKSFVESVQKGEPTDIDVFQGARELEILFKLKESNELKKWISI